MTGARGSFLGVDETVVLYARLTRRGMKRATANAAAGWSGLDTRLEPAAVVGLLTDRWMLSDALEMCCTRLYENII